MRNVFWIGVTAAMLGASASGVTLGGTAGVAMAGDAGEGGALDHARRATKALGRDNAVAAVGFAEAAVAASPHNADYRALLGRSYLRAGRFQSARQALADALTLRPGDGRTALDHALTQIATGDWLAARETLERYADRLALADRGLAAALAGDPAAGVAMLTQAARQPGAGATVRQNLALAYALGGEWRVARVVAAADLSPADLDRRMQDWATFAQPKGAADQVASLLGVTPVADPGQPVALALNTAPAAALADAVAAPEPQERVTAVVPAAEPAPTAQLAAKVTVVFGPRREVVQPIPVERSVALMRSEARPVRVAQGGNWFVQVGAYENAAVARDAWGRMERNFAGHQPHGTNIRRRGGSLYRLSIGGFQRADAINLCVSHRARGGSCFVRRGQGDQVASWARRGGTQLASVGVRLGGGMRGLESGKRVSAVGHSP